MNALVEDQQSSVRRAMDSPEAHAVMDARFAGNRFSSDDTPVLRTGGRTPEPSHAVRTSTRELDRRLHRRVTRVADAMTGSQKDQDRRSSARRADIPHDDPTRYLFPRTDGGELVARWDMQQTPPDILVTNVSMLGTMLSREIEEPIFARTKEWLETDPNAYFFPRAGRTSSGQRLSPGPEVAGLLRALVHRLGLSEPADPSQASDPGLKRLAPVRGRG